MSLSARSFPSVLRRLAACLPLSRSRLAELAVAALVVLFGLGFGWLSLQRHETYRTNAEDLGFTDQVIWNFLRGQAFRFSIYERAEFTTDIDLAALKRPDSLLAFHVEPILALFAPLYLLWADVRLLLLVQAVGWSLGAVPAYRLARRRLGSGLAGICFAAIYLLSPLGQWALLSDFHTVLFAAPLLLWAVDLMEEQRSLPTVLAGLLAVLTKEEVGLVVAGLGLLACCRPRMRSAGIALLTLGAGWSLLCVTVIIPGYAGTVVSPFTARYAELGGSPAQLVLNLFHAPGLYAEALGRPEVLAYVLTLLLAGGWLALLAPELLVPILPSLALNSLSSSPWMASGRAHYSSTVLPFMVFAAIVGCQRLAGWLASSTRNGSVMKAIAQRAGKSLAGLALLSTASAYHYSGAGPLSDGFQIPRRTSHHDLADRLLARIPADAKVSASSSLVPHLSQRTDIYLFPTVREAEYVALDVTSPPFPISAGDMYLRAIAMLGNGEWRQLEADDGLLLLSREASPSQPLPDRFFSFAKAGRPSPDVMPLASYLDGAIELISGELRASGEIGLDGPLGSLRTIWRTTRPLETATRPRVIVQLAAGSEQEHSDFAALWWYPPERWRPGELVVLEVPGLPLRKIAGWRAIASPDGHRATTVLDPGPRCREQQTRSDSANNGCRSLNQ